MKSLVRPQQIGCTLIAGLSVVAFQPGSAAELKEARVTYVVNDVALLPPQAAPRAAKVPDPVRDGMAVRTGTNSRSELTFTDLTITRLGANTIFSFNEGTRNLDLKEGAILLRVPKNVGGAKITTAAVTAAITGTTVMMEYHPHGSIKAIGLEGIFRMYLKKRPGESVLVHPGQMIIMRADATRLPDPVDVDLKQLLKSSLLITGFPPLPSAGLIAQAAQTQAAEKASGQLVATNLVIFGSGTVVSLLDQTNIDQISQAVVAQAPGPPSEFGPPSTITSFNPYPITDTTVITTDPTITTNGVTDFGKIYRGPGEDGAFSDYAFGSTSTFDAVAQINGLLADPANLPLAVFKFQSLSLLGNPTVLLGNGGATKLFLLADNGISSGPPGGTLTFSGLDMLGLATTDGPIDLTSDISFQNLPFLFVYARGANSTLTFDSSVSGTTDLYLQSQGDLRVTDTLDVTQVTTGQTTGLNISLRAGRNINVAGDLSLTTDATNVQNGGNIFVTSGRDMTIGGAFTLFTDVDAGSTTGTGGNIIVTSGGSLTAGSLNFDLFFDPSDKVTNGENVTLNVAGNLTTTAGGASLGLSTPTPAGHPLVNGGNLNMTIGGNLTLASGSDLTLFVINTVFTDVGTGANISAAIGGNLNADAISARITNDTSGGIGTGGNLSFAVDGNLNTSSLLAQITNTANGNITAGGNLVVNIGNNLTSTGSTEFSILNNDGGHIGTGGNITLNIGGNIQTDPSVTVQAIVSNEGGTIGSNDAINVKAANITAGGLSVEIDNGNSGVIGGDGTINLSAANLSVGSAATVLIDNSFGGTINGNATINTNVSGTDVRIDNSNGGMIGGNAAINVSTTNISLGGDLLTAIDNSGGGTIGGAAKINEKLSGKASVSGDATFAIYGSDATAAAAINFGGGSYSVGGTFLAFTDGNGTVTFNNTTVTADVLKVGALGTNGVLRIGGGTLSANTELQLYAPGSNGQLNFVSNVTLDGLGTKILAANSVTIFNNVVVTVGGDVAADVYTNNPNYSQLSGGNGSTTGTFAGAGARPPQPLSRAPVFDPPPPHPATTTISTRKTHQPVMNVSDTDQLLSVLENTAPASNRKITAPTSQNRSHLKHSTRLEAAGRLQTDRGATEARGSRPIL
jgi:hypothetical protein